MLLALLLAATPQMTWHGGPVLEHARFHNLYWGSYWTLHQDDREWMDAWTAAVAPSQELASQVAEYSVNGQHIGAASVVDSHLLTDDNPPATITTQDLSDFIERELQAGNVPRPTSEADVYTVFLHPGVTISDETKAVGYHRRSPYGFHEIMVHFDGYVISVASRNVASVTYSHEMAETITDPDLNGWYDDATQEEIGDVCQGKLGSVGTSSIQQEWSNAEGKCMAARDVPLPPGDNGVCPSGMHLDPSGSCTGNVTAWGCSTGVAGWPAFLGLALLLFRFRQSSGKASPVR